MYFLLSIVSFLEKFTQLTVTAETNLTTPLNFFNSRQRFLAGNIDSDRVSGMERLRTVYFNEFVGGSAATNCKVILYEEPV